MPVELKPCPFCGGTDLFIERLDYSSAFVQCDSEVSPGCACMARGPVGSQDDDGEDIPGAESAVREWNRRADQQTVAKLQARVAELEAALADEREVHVSVSSASDDELTKTRDALRRLEVSANSVAYCYRHRPENFAGALLALEDDAAFAREVSGDQP